MIKTNCPKLVKNSIIPAIALLLLVPGIVSAATDSTINFQGKIVRNDTGYEGLNVTAGNPACVVDGNGNDTCDFQVKYYSASSGGTLLLTEVFSNVEIGQYNGAFTLSLGSDGAPTAGTYAACKGGTCDNLQEVVNAVSDLYVELGFAPGGSGSYTETFSRMPIQASAYALKAKYAEKASTAFQFDTAANSSGYTSPSAGMVYYDTTDSELKVYDGASWGSLGGGSGSLFTDGGIFTYLTALTDHFVLGSSSYTAIGSDSYTTYLSGLSGRAPLSFDMTAKRLTLSGNQAQSGLTVYSSYNSTGAWPVVSMKAEGSNFDNVVLQVTQDGTGNILSLQKGSTDAFVFENPLTFYIHPRTDAPTVSTNRLYNINGALYWNGSPVGGASLWTDGGTFTYLTSTTDDVIIGGDSGANAKFFFDVSTGNLGIGTSTPGAKLDIAGSSSTISNSTGDITISPDDTVVIKANDTQADNLMEWQNSTGTVLGLINQNGYATFGGSTSNTSAMLTLGASTSGVAQLNFTNGFDVSAPNSGDMWWNGTSLFFYDGTQSVDLLTSGGGGSDVLSAYGSVANEGYLNLQHDTNSYDVVADGWICVGGSSNESCTGGNWKNITDTDFTIRESLSNQWNDADNDGIIRSIVKLTDVELAPGINVGTGADGEINIISDTDINAVNSIVGRSCADGGDAVNYSVTALATNTATLESSPSAGCLNPGDEVLLINLRGTTTAQVNVGKFETLRVSNVASTTVTFTLPKTKYYGENATDDTNIGLSTTNQIVMLQRIPNYTNVTLTNSGTDFTASAWVVPNGSANNGAGEGGVMFFRANGSVVVAAGTTINTNAKGYTGGSGSSTGGNSGESLGGIIASGGAYSSQGVYGGGSGNSYTAAGVAGLNGGGGGGGQGNGDANDGAGGGAGGGYAGGGGGGGAGSDSGGTGGSGGTGAVTAGTGAGGGGGANGGAGGAAGSAGSGTGAGAAGSGYTTGQGGRGAGGSTGAGGAGGGGYYGVADLSSIYFGSGGGQGGGYYGGTNGQAGGAGGGIITISATTITVSGQISSNGGAGTTGTSGAGGGGAGAGGSVRLSGANLTLGSSLVTATGGSGTAGATRVGGGGYGSIGRVAVYYSVSITGSSSPSYSGTSVGNYGYGVYTSSVISTPNAQSYDNITWDSTLNTYGKISVQTRSGSSNDPTDGTWEGWRPYTSGTNYTTLQSADTHTDFTGTNATVAEGDIGRDVNYFEDEDEPLVTNITKMTSSTNGGYMEATISSTNLSTYDYVTLWVRAGQTGNVLRIGMGESAGTEQYEDITIDTANTWQKVYWDISDITSTSRDAITKIRLTNFSTVSNTIYLDNVRGESLLDTGAGSVVSTTPNDYFQYRVIFTTTNTAYVPQLENIAMAWNSGYRIVMYDANNTRLYNYSGGTEYLRLDVVASTAGSGSGGSGFINGLAVSHVQDGTDAIAFQFDTDMAFTDPTSKLMSVLNNGTEMMYLDADGNLYVSGTITAGKGLSAALVNRSGGTVAERGLVTVDPNYDSSFTTTTIAGLQGAMGVVQGVKMGSDLDSDGVCDNGDTCLVAFEGVVNVDLDNAASSSRGDYIYTSTTAAQGHAEDGTAQTNGLIGIVTSVANSGSGYVQMVFDAQNKVTADLYLNINIGLDKSAYRDMYNQLANDYAAMTDAERRGVVESNQSQSVMFDSFVDSLKMDSSTSTVGVDGDAQKAGLWGGLTIDGTTIDIAGNRYLGSATATLLYTKYYDRSQTGLQDQDSTPATLVNLGIDPNWYNGVSLQTNTNLTTSYNGSLVGVSGTYASGSEHGYVDLTVTGITVSGLTANIVSSDGNCSVTGATLTFGSSYAFGAGSCSGSTIAIKPVRGDFKSGDRFRIASWYLEPATSDDRGSERTFPVRSLIVGSADSGRIYITVIDADTQKMWMKFVSDSATYAGGNMLVNNTSRAISALAMINGQLSIGANGGTNEAGYMEVNFMTDSGTSTHTTGTWKFNGSIAERNSARAYTQINTNMALVSNIVNDVSANVVWNKPTQDTTVSGWGWIQGNSSAATGETVYFPYKFNSNPDVVVNGAGQSDTSAPQSLSDCTVTGAPWVRSSSSITASSFYTTVRHNNDTVSPTTSYFCYTWTATGQVSPKMAVAVATGTTGTDGNASLINKSDQSTANLLIGSQHANVLWTNKIALDTRGNMYVSLNDDTAGSTNLVTYRGITTKSSETSWWQYVSGAYLVGVASAGTWSSSGPVILGTAATNQIKSLSVLEGTSTIDGKSNTIYVGTSLGVSVIQEKQSGNATLADGLDERNGSIQYYTKDYISEKMTGDIRGMWPLNYDNTSADNEDVSIKANALAATNIDSNDAVSGVRGKAVDFNGTDEYLYRASDADFDLTNYLTISVWAKGSSGRILSRYGQTSGGATTNAYYFLNFMSDKPTLLIRDDTDATGQTLTANTAVNDGNWHHIVAVVNKPQALVSIYIDGVLDSSFTLTETGTYTFDDPIYIGAYQTSGGVMTAYYTGSLDDLMVSASVVSDSVIKNMYQEGLRALKGSHSTADTYNQLNGTTNDVRSILVSPDNRNMYVGTEGGGISNIDLTSSTRVNTYTTSTDPLTSSNNVESLSGRYYPILSGDIGSSARLMGIDSNGNNSTGTYYSKTVTFDTQTNRAYLWMSAYIDSTDTSSSIAVSASNDGGATYVTGTLVKTNTTGTVPEYEYSFTFPSSDNEYKVKFVITRGSSNKASAYVTKWGLAQMELSDGTVNGSFTQTGNTVANGSYIDVVHGQNTYDLIATGWVFDTALNKWVEVTNTDNGITQNLSNQWNDAAIGGIIRSVVKLTDVELAPGINVGTGADGDIIISANTSINAINSIIGRTCVDGGDAVNYNVTAFNGAGTEATLSSSPSTGCLVAGDEVLIINLQGTSTIYGNVGNYETLRISGVSGSTVTFQTAKTKFYGDGANDDSNLGVVAGTQRVMMQRVPNYNDVTINSTYTLSPTAWNGVKGGVLFFRANGVISVNGSISANGLGYRGGSGGPSGREPGGYLGESFNGYNLISGGGSTTAAINAGGRNGAQATASPANGIVTGGGGGGGSSTYASPDEVGGGGGGGGYAGGGGGGGGAGGSGYGATGGAGGSGGGIGISGGGGGGANGSGTGGAGGSAGNAGSNAAGTGGSAGSGSVSGSGGGGAAAADAGAAGGGGGGLYGASSLDRLYFGSGGGGGGGSSCNLSSCAGGPWVGETGGSGGGIILISTASLTNSGAVTANGNNGSAATYGGNGGSGAGGSILLQGSNLVLGSATITTSGGAATGSAGGPGGGGGGGGVGRIAVSYANSVTGSTSPTYSSTTIGNYAYGVYTSSVISTPNAQSYDNITWDASLNTYGKISVQTRSGATTDPTDGTWEGWRPYTSGTNYITVQSADTHTDFTGTNATVAEGDIGRNVDYFEDEDEAVTTNMTKMTSSTNGGYMEATISSTDLSTYDYVTLWVRAGQTGNVLRIGMGESAGTEQYEDITIDTANTWQKVYWDLSDITSTSRDAITKIRLTNFSTTSNTIYLDNVRGESLLDTGSGSVVATTPNDYFQYRVIFTTTNTAYVPQLENITFTYSTGFQIQIIDANTVRMYNNTGETQQMKLNVIVGNSVIDLQGSQYTVNIAPNTAQIDGGNNTNSIWINKLGTGGNLLKLQTNSVDMMVVSAEGDMTLAGDVAIGGSVVLGATGDQGTIRYNATDNRIEFSNDGISWMQLGDNTRAITLSAEYAGAVLSGDGSDNVGNMTSDNTGSSSNSMNYYEWSSSAVALNDYDVRVRFTLPSDFVSWGNGGVTLNYATESTSNTNNKVDMYVYLEGSATVDGSSTAQVSSSAGVWATTNVAGSGLDECNAAGETCVVILRMYSLGDNYTRIGDIDITYNRSL